VPPGPSSWPTVPDRHIRDEISSTSAHPDVDVVPDQVPPFDAVDAALGRLFGVQVAQLRPVGFLDVGLPGQPPILDAELDLVVVAEAGDGAEAIEMATRGEVYLAVLDIATPRMTGLQAGRELAGALLRCGCSWCRRRTTSSTPSRR
jgi:CheY-like chemotaxis protein